MRSETTTSLISWVFVAGVTGLEPATSGLTGQRSNHLSYTPEWGNPQMRIANGLYIASLRLSSFSRSVFS